MNTEAARHRPGNGPDDRSAARARAAALLDLPPPEIENDLLAFLTVGGDALLRARAGSGKTTALAIKAAHLTLDRGIDPSRIMMLAFNNAAARSLERRLKSFGVPDGVRVRTFHALGQRIVRAHFGGSRTPVFDEKTEEGQAIAGMLAEARDEAIDERFFHFCAGRMRTRYDKRRDYVEGVGGDALLSAVNFLRARGYGLQKRMDNAWDEGGPIAGNAMKVVMGFERRLKEARLLDGPGVLQAASWSLERELEKGVARPSDAHDIDWIFIDEYQDVSLPYMRLVHAIRALNGGANIQGVGDDWQAVNGFAGADLTYFDRAADHLDEPSLLNLLRNRRSGSEIVAWGNAAMADAGYPDAPAIPDPSRGEGEGEVTRARVSAARDLRYIASRLATLVDREMTSTALIARKWKIGVHGLPALKRMVEAQLRDEGCSGRITGLTAHGCKGLEYDQVLLLDDGSFPLNHPSRPILESLIPETDYLREEACLRHVAGTRARKRLCLVEMG